jgi:hypothetical protein
MSCLTTSSLTQLGSHLPPLPPLPRPRRWAWLYQWRVPTRGLDAATADPVYTESPARFNPSPRSPPPLPYNRALQTRTRCSFLGRSVHPRPSPPPTDLRRPCGSLIRLLRGCWISAAAEDGQLLRDAESSRRRRRRQEAQGAEAEEG